MTAPRRLSLASRSENETFEAGRALARDLHAGDTVLLEGNLGAGKTVFARGIAAGLGVDPATVRSPTFTLVNPYSGLLPVHHVDLYRIEAAADLSELGLEDILGGEGVAIVEWPERLGPYHPEDAVVVGLEDLGGSERTITIEDRRRGRRD